MTSAFDNALQLANEIAACDKTPREKIEAIRTSIYPLIRREFQLGIPNWDEIAEISRKFDEIFKIALGVPPEAHSAYLYAPITEGCIGLVSMEDYVKILHFSNFLTVFSTATDDFSVEEARYYYENTPEIASMLDHWKDRTYYRDIGDVNKGRVTNVSRGIFWTLDLMWTEGKIPVLTTSIINSWRTRVLRKENVQKIEEVLLEMVQTAIYRKWTTAWKRGADDITGYVRSAATCPDVSTFYLKPGSVSLSPLDETFIHQAKTGTTMLLDDPFPAKMRSSFIGCFDCEKGYEKKSLTHVVTMCNMELITKRHDSILTLLVEAIRKGSKANFIITLDSEVPESEFCQRPDLVMRSRHEDTQEIIVLDVACPLETHPNQLDKAHQTKKKKYRHIKLKLKEEHPEADVRLRSFVVGALGSWRDENWKTLDILGIPSELQPRLTQLMAKSVICHSRFIYEEALSGYQGTSQLPDDCTKEL